MDPVKNPYRPGAGTKPLVLAGRDREIQAVRTLLRTVKGGAPQRSVMFYGLRGVGKTVLLNDAEAQAEHEGYVVEHLEMSEGDDFRREIAKATRRVLLSLSARAALKERAVTALRVLKAFSIVIPGGPELKIDVDAAVGSADSGDLESDLVELFLAVGSAAAEADRAVCFSIDEVQYLEEKAFAGLIAASHRIAQKNLPVVFICAGLPQVAALAGDAKSYAERLFEFIPIASLKDGAAEAALREPARAQSVEYDADAAALLLGEAEGYPYFIQEFGKHAWNIAETNPISLTESTRAVAEATEALDNSFFKARLDRATQAEKTYLKAMAVLGSGPYKVADVANGVGQKVTSLGPVRATLISKGFVYSPQHGAVAFTVPQFDKFIRRYYHLKPA